MRPVKFRAVGPDVLSNLPSGTVYTGHTNGWNAATGDGDDYTLNNAWLAVYGDNDGVTFEGAGDKVSFNGPSTGVDTETVVGSGGAITARAGFGDGDGDVIYCNGVGDAVSFYGTGAAGNTVYAEAAASVTLNDAKANLTGNSLQVYFQSGGNVADLSDSSLGLPRFSYGPVHDTFIGFGASDRLVLNTDSFADFAAFERAFQQQGADAVLTYNFPNNDGSDSITFLDTKIADVTAAQVSFFSSPLR